MKYVAFIVPECEVNLTAFGGAYEILSRANNYWQELGNNSKVEIQIAGFVSDLKLLVTGKNIKREARFNGSFSSSQQNTMSKVFIFPDSQLCQSL